MTLANQSYAIDILRSSIERNTAALNNAKPTGSFKSTPANLLQQHLFIQGMIHAYRLVTDFKANDSFQMLAQVDLALKNAQKTFKTAKKVAAAAEAQRAVVQAKTL